MNYLDASDYNEYREEFKEALELFELSDYTNLPELFEALTYNDHIEVNSEGVLSFDIDEEKVRDYFKEYTAKELVNIFEDEAYFTFKGWLSVSRKPSLYVLQNTPPEDNEKTEEEYYQEYQVNQVFTFLSDNSDSLDENPYLLLVSEEELLKSFTDNSDKKYILSDLRSIEYS